MLKHEKYLNLFENVNTNYKDKLINLFNKFINNEDMYSDLDFIQDLYNLLDSIRNDYNDYSLNLKIKFFKTDNSNTTINDIVNMLTTTNQNYEYLVADINLAIDNPKYVELVII